MVVPNIVIRGFTDKAKLLFGTRTFFMTRLTTATEDGINIVQKRVGCWIDVHHLFSFLLLH
jgi:hypothetical protein